jgi:hypothetical protein
MVCRIKELKLFILQSSKFKSKNMMQIGISGIVGQWRTDNGTSGCGSNAVELRYEANSNVNQSNNEVFEKK